MKKLSLFTTLLFFFNNAFCAQASLNSSLTDCCQEIISDVPKIIRNTERTSTYIPTKIDTQRDLDISNQPTWKEILFNPPPETIDKDLAKILSPQERKEEEKKLRKKTIASVSLLYNEITASDFSQIETALKIPQYRFLINLNLSLNSFSELPPNFIKHPGIQAISLIGCTITSIDKEAFHGLPQLSRVALQTNNFKELDASCFANPAKIKKLRINTNNYLNHLPNFEKLTSLENLYIDPFLIEQEEAKEGIMEWAKNVRTKNPISIWINSKYGQEEIEKIQALIPSDKENINIYINNTVESCE